MNNNSKEIYLYYNEEKPRMVEMSKCYTCPGGKTPGVEQKLIPKLCSLIAKVSKASLSRSLKASDAGRASGHARDNNNYCPRS